MMKRRVVIPIVISSVVLMLSAFVILTNGMHAVENIEQTHSIFGIVEPDGARP